MENFGIQQPGFNSRAREGGLVPALKSFELFVGKTAGSRIKMEDPIFREKYPEEEIRADIAETTAFFKKYFQGDNAEFRPSMLAEELVKIGGRFGLFGEGGTVDQSAPYDDYKHNADVVAKVTNNIRDKKDERLLRPSERFVIDVTTDQGERSEEKANKLSGELRSGKLSEVKYFPGIGRGLHEVPRFVLEIDEEEIFTFFEKAKTSLDSANGVNEKRFAEQYEIFSHGVCKKILSSARAQVKYIMECAIDASLPTEISNKAAMYLNAPLGGFYEALEYVDGVNPASLGITNEDNKIKVSIYLTMVKKILRVGVAIERALEEKKKRASTQGSEALH